MSEIKAYCDFYGVKDLQTRHFLVKIIAVLCDEMLQYKEEKRKREMAKANMGKPK